ncbi:MAG TPA: helix-turn-helix domain-containing protein [Roseiflexaceae bacterium]|nr:helix-turn-helix domain-containing protein [Roseiflexaceae bacterium]
MTDPVALLQQLGFSEYEARAYLALLQQNPLNGYELAKVSGVPRANIYAVLQKLEERGAVVRLDMPSSSRYAPVTPAQLTERIGSRFQDVVSATRQALEELATPAAAAYIWNIEGYPPLLDHARALIDATQEQVLIALRRQEAGALAGALSQAEARGIAVTTLCLDECPEVCGGCRGTICRSCAALAAEQHWLVLVADEAEMLAGEIDAHGHALAVRTRQRLQVDLTSWYIRHSVALAAVLGDLSRRPDQVLAPETRTLLQSVDQPDRRGGWLDHLRVLVRGAR